MANVTKIKKTFTKRLFSAISLSYLAGMLSAGQYRRQSQWRWLKGCLGNDCLLHSVKSPALTLANGVQAVIIRRLSAMTCFRKSCGSTATTEIAQS